MNLKLLTGKPAWHMNLIDHVIFSLTPLRISFAVSNAWKLSEKLMLLKHVINHHLLSRTTSLVTKYIQNFKFIREVYLNIFEADIGAYYVRKRSTTQTELNSVSYFPVHQTFFYRITFIYKLLYLLLVFNTSVL